MTFPPDFRWGTATAAYQVEGNNTNSDWWAWEQQNGRIVHNHKSGDASNWWRDAERDLDTAVAMGTNAHRLSLEWSRIEPKPSVFDSSAIDRYRFILQAMHDRGIEPMVTLHHFSNPLWLVEKKDFNSQIVVDYFQRYVAKVADTLGDLIPKWITINEPMVYAFNRFLTGAFPAPLQRGWLPTRQAVVNMLRCHAAAYHAIKERQPQAQVGVAKNVPIIVPVNGESRVQRRWATLLSWLFNDVWMQSMTNGRLPRLLGGWRIKHLANAYDFIGLNYYSRYYVKFPPSAGFYEQDWGADAIVSDGNYGEVYPAGLFTAIKMMLPYNKPMYITENGVPDSVDRLRPSFIITHLREVWRAVSFCFPVLGYYHWSLVDNFEWHNGWTQRFGLIELDTETQERRLRESGRLYSEICHSGTVSSDMASRYAPQLLTTLFRGRPPEQTK